MSNFRNPICSARLPTHSASARDPNPKHRIQSNEWVPSTHNHRHNTLEYHLNPLASGSNEDAQLGYSNSKFQEPELLFLAANALSSKTLEIGFNQTNGRREPSTHLIGKNVVATPHIPLQLEHGNARSHCKSREEGSRTHSKHGSLSTLTTLSNPPCQCLGFEAFTSFSTTPCASMDAQKLAIDHAVVLLAHIHDPICRSKASTHRNHVIGDWMRMRTRTRTKTKTPITNDRAWPWMTGISRS